jgi:hypothetical protein
MAVQQARSNERQRVYDSAFMVLCLLRLWQQVDGGALMVAQGARLNH